MKESSPTSAVRLVRGDDLTFALVQKHLPRRVRTEECSPNELRGLFPTVVCGLSVQTHSLLATHLDVLPPNQTIVVVPFQMDVVSRVITLPFRHVIYELDDS